jgi:hypothetical protein
MTSPRRLVGVNTVLLALCGLFVFQLARTLTTPTPTAPQRSAPTSVGGAPTTVGTSADRAAKSEEGTAAPKRAELTAYTAIASKNLFSPSRSESGAGPAASPAGSQAPKPWLHGVVVSDAASIAYLEDPATKRITAHRIGDSLPAGTVQSIAPDRVMLTGPGGSIEVRLRDPSKPRPARPPMVTPGAPTPSRPEVPPAAVPAVPPTPLPGSPGSPVPRPFPPNLLRRTPLAPGMPPGGEQAPASPQPGVIPPSPGAQPETAPPPLPRGMLPSPRPTTHG